MRWVQQAAIAPHRCAVIPFIGNSNARGGFLDTGRDMRERDHLYLSHEACEQIARALGWQPPHVAQVYKQQLEAEKAENARLGGVIAELEAHQEKIEYTLSTLGQKARAKPGRKPREEVAA